MNKPSGAVGVVLAAGMGTRVGVDGNKAYLPLAGRSMVSWSLDAMLHVAEVTRTVLVFRRGERELAERTVHDELPDATVEFVEGGETRHGSEFNVLTYLATDIESGAVDAVLIHDAARPLAGPAMIRTALSVARERGGAVPAVVAADVVRLTESGEINALPGRLVRVQTPQAFRALPLLEAYRKADDAGFEGTDTASCVERFTDLEVRTFPGAEHNLKVTYAQDIAVAGHLLSGGTR
ncbi:IspD/TarI family cytidylyltransferase [Mycobacterium hubeiense]|uniref:IspD/TarI family cytidylyltransferase n=1 Tax=Mycobacterium hubeiense TaxID=1867256 RepID=UPI000C7F7003|nr:IspD/TarI family cytidylyltransferase [Mycobacterium sp. QGD 101]